ncbi:DUF262 domain-containing protein [Mesorhizobium sp. ORM8.1]
MASPDNLESQVSEARRSISSDGYPMSIGELTNLYRDGELIIRPEFQRFFRWNETQKSRLVESILLGIPLPSIFVAQTTEGKWELVDGLQRISTILELQGELRDKQGVLQPPLALEKTKFLPALEGRVWESANHRRSLSEAQRLDIKRSKIDIKIIKRDSSPQAKFDLFQRLNSYGTILNSQELRSALIVSVSPEFFAWIEALATYPNFIQSTQLSDRLIEERFDLELVTRFIVLHNRPTSKLTLTSLRDLPQILDDEIVQMAFDNPSGDQASATAFKKTFDTIASNGADLVFKRWDTDKSEFKGSFLSTAFEVFALGIGYHAANRTPFRTDILDVVKEFWAQPHMEKGYATGRSTEARLIQFIPEGRKITAA